MCTLSVVLLEEALWGLKLSSVESKESPSSFLMSSSSLSRLIPLTTLSVFLSKAAGGTIQPTSLGLHVTPTSGPFGDALLQLSTVTAALFLRKRFPFGLWSLLDCDEASTDFNTLSGCGELPLLACSRACWRLRIRISIWSSLLFAAVWEPSREDDTYLFKWGKRDTKQEDMSAMINSTGIISLHFCSYDQFCFSLYPGSGSCCIWLPRTGDWLPLGAGGGAFFKNLLPRPPRELWGLTAWQGTTQQVQTTSQKADCHTGITNRFNVMSSAWARLQ